MNQLMKKYKTVTIDAAVIPQESDAGTTYVWDSSSFDEVLNSCVDAN